MGLQGHVLPTTGAMNAAPKPAPTPEVTTPAEVVTTETPKPEKKAGQKQVKGAPKAEVKEQIEAAIEVAEDTNAPKDQLYEFEIDGKQKLMTLDQMKREVQKGIAAESRFREAANMRKEAEGILELYKTNPTLALQKLGHNVRELAENYLAEEIKKEMMSPEAREALEIKRENEELKKQLKEGDDIAKAQKQAAEKARWAKKYDEELTSAMEKAGLQKDPAIIRNVARIMHDYLSTGYEITAEDAVKEFQDSMLSQASTLIKLLGPQRASQMLGDDFMNSIRKEDLKKIKNPLTPSGDNGNFGTRAVPRKEKEEKLTMDEWKRRNRERVSS